MRWLLVIICTTPFLPAQPVETVDFSLPPREGLVLDIEKRREARWRDRDRSDGPPRTSVRTESIQHTVVRVRAGVVAAVERRYKQARRGRAGSRATKSMASPLLGQTIRATWNAKSCEMAVKRDGGWKVVGWLVLVLSDAEMRAPLLPLGNEVRRVGESWEMDFRTCMLSLTGDTPFVGSGKATLCLRSIGREANAAARRVATIDVAMRLEVEREDMNVSGVRAWEGTAVYDLADRVVVKLDARGTSQVRSMRGEARDRLASTTVQETLSAKATVVAKPQRPAKRE